MPKLVTLKDKIKYRIKKSKDFVFLIKDFSDLSDNDQILRALRTLVSERFLIRVGKGLYVKAKISLVSGTLIPQENLRNIATAALSKLGVAVLETGAEKAYNNKLTTQVPNGFVIGVNKRVSRNISFGMATILYDKVN